MTTDIKETPSHVILQAATQTGNKYEIGFPKARDYTANEIVAEAVALTGDARDFKKLQWVPGEHGITSREAEEIGIVTGYVSNDRGVIYSYRINFFNRKGWSFKFLDESGDVYEITTIRNGWHYIDYNSDKPTIIGVK